MNTTNNTNIADILADVRTRRVPDWTVDAQDEAWQMMMRDICSDLGIAEDTEEYEKVGEVVTELIANEIAELTAIGENDAYWADMAKHLAEDNSWSHSKDADAIASIECSYNDDRYHDAVFETVQNGRLFQNGLKELGIDEDSDEAQDLLFALIEYLIDTEEEEG